MPFRGQEGLILVLAVYVDQPPPNLPQDREGGRLSADLAQVATVGRQCAREDKAAILRRVAERGNLLRQRGREGENCGHLGPVAAGADQVAGGALSQYGAYGVDDNGFSGAGLAGQQVEAGGQLKAGTLDHGDVFNI